MAATSPQSGAVNTPEGALNREELLSAIDYQIAHRQDGANREGFSRWGLVGAGVILFWTALQEASDVSTDSPVGWMRVVIVFFSGSIALGWLKVLLMGRPKPDLNLPQLFHPGRWMTMAQFLALKSHASNGMAYKIAEHLVLSAVAIALAVNVNPWIGGSLAIIQLVALAIFTVGTLMTKLRAPFARPEIEPKSSLRGRTKALIYAVVSVPAILLAYLIVQKWPTITGNEWKLGFLLVGLQEVFQLIVTHTVPDSQLAPLRTIRTQLSFGWISVEKARAQVEDYVTEAVQEVIAIFQLIRGWSDERVAQMQEVIDLAKELKECPDEAAFKQQHAAKVLDARRSVFDRVGRVDELFSRAQKGGRSLNIRIKTAKTFLDLREAEIPTLMKPAVAARGDALVSYDRFRGILSEFFQAHNALVVSTASSSEQQASVLARLKEIREMLMHD